MLNTATHGKRTAAKAATAPSRYRLADCRPTTWCEVSRIVNRLLRDATAMAAETNVTLRAYMITATATTNATAAVATALWAETPPRPRQSPAANVEMYSCPALKSADRPTTPSGG